MKAKLFVERGQALIIIALAAVGLFAVTGLAIDGSAKFSDRRHAQNAADTAALAGALAKSRAEQDISEGASLTNSPVACPNASPSDVCQAILDAAKERATENGYDGDLVRSVVNVYRPPATGIYSNCSDVHFNCNDYVQVTIDSNVDTYFARVIGINQIHNHVEAVASTVSQQNSFNFGGNAIVALKPTGCDALKAQGGSQVKVYGGGLYSNSDDSSCSFFRQSCAGSGYLDIYQDDTETTPGTITMVGNYTTSCASIVAGYDSGATQISFPPPYDEISEPSVCSNPTTSAPGGTTVTLSPGHYSSMPPRPNIQNTTLLPGVYCIDTEIRTNAGDVLTVSGSFPSSPGVLLYIRSGGSFTMNASSTINIWGINQASVDGDSSLSSYKGFLIYAAPNYALTTPPNCKLNGNTDYALSGTIYAPYCAITIDGTSNTGSFLSQVIGYTVNMAGTANVLLDYTSGDNAVWQIPWQVGLSN